MEEKKYNIADSMNPYISTFDFSDDIEGELLKARLENAYLQGYIDAQKFHFQKLLRNEKDQS